MGEKFRVVVGAELRELPPLLGEPALHPIRCPALGLRAVLESAFASTPLTDPRGHPDIQALVSEIENDLLAAQIEGEPVPIAGLAESKVRN